ncbi:MAG: hypothetical protein RR837_10050, partial [Bacteroidales bacterium]
RKLIYAQMYKNDLKQQFSILLYGSKVWVGYRNINEQKETYKSGDLLNRIMHTLVLSKRELNNNLKSRYPTYGI